MRIAYKKTDLYTLTSKKSRTNKVIYDDSIQSLKFNVLNDKHVEEKLSFSKFIVSADTVETYFDRDYKTDMTKSPDHFIFLSALVNLQKMIYLLMCERFNVPYKKNGKERFKIWPINVDVKMNGMIRRKKNLMQDFKINAIEKKSNTKYHISGESSSDSTVYIKGTALVYLI